MDMDQETELDTLDALSGGSLANGGLCAATTAAGNPCYTPALEGDLFCFSHSPQHAEERKLIAQRGNATAGRGRPARTVEYREIKGRLADLIKRVDSEQLDTKRASVEGYLYDVLLRAIKQEEESEAIEIRERIELLEERIGGGTRWVT